MGYMAELMLEGYVCQTCGMTLEDGDAPGHPRYCHACGGDPETNYASLRKGKQKSIQRAAKPFQCKECGKRFTTEDGMWQHDKDKH